MNTSEICWNLEFTDHGYKLNADTEYETLISINLSEDDAVNIFKKLAVVLGYELKTVNVAIQKYDK